MYVPAHPVKEATFAIAVKNATMESILPSGTFPPRAGCFEKQNAYCVGHLSFSIFRVILIPGGNQGKSWIFFPLLVPRLMAGCF
jgi:hypothetical protein